MLIGLDVPGPVFTFSVTEQSKKIISVTLRGDGSSAALGHISRR